MKFDTFNDRKEAIKIASETLGIAYGKLKYAEQLFRETCQSFVPGMTETGVAPAPAPAKEEEPKAVPKKKAKATSKKKAEPEDDGVDVEVLEEELKSHAKPEVEVEVEIEEAEAEDEPTVKDHSELRALFTERYKELGGNPAVRTALLNKLKETTGKDQVADVDPADFTKVVKALAEVKV